jgi:anti-sigma B factor antagonist
MNETNQQSVTAAAQTDVGVSIKVERLEQAPDVAMIRCKGYIDTYNYTQFSRMLEPVIDGGTNRLVFEMSKVTYISSTGIGAFLYLLKRVRPNSGNIVLMAMLPKVQEVFQLLGFECFFDRADTIEEALPFFPGSPAKSAIPFNTMQALTDTFKRLEQLVAREKLSKFYEEIVSVLKHIEQLKAAKFGRG